MMLTTTTQKLNHGEIRVLYAKLGNLAEPTWRVVGSITHLDHGLRAEFLPEAASFRPLWKACARPQCAGTQDLLRVIFGMASDRCGVTQIASGFATPAACAEIRKIGGNRAGAYAAPSGHATIGGGPASLRTSYPGWVVDNGGTDAAGRPA